ncbi:MAG TPA: hypothetical protein PKD18_10375 [Saprospiraceae bacterium]|nr:hypothetical protein [Saprospiraceae bacterium]
MTEAEKLQYYRYHNENLIHLKFSFAEIKRQILDNFRNVNSSSQLVYALNSNSSDYIEAKKLETTYSRLLSGIQVCITEENLKRLVYEPKAFNSIQIDEILNQTSLNIKWELAFKIGFCNAFELTQPGNPSCRNFRISRQRNNLGDELCNKYSLLKNVIDQNLLPNFRVRNKILHGEWINAFEPPNSKIFSTNYSEIINNETLPIINHRLNIANSFYNLIVDLVRFNSDAFKLNSLETPFEYFYNKYMQKISEEATKINQNQYTKYVENIIKKTIIGIQKKSVSI